MLLVTGATGFVGSNLVPALVKKGYEVRALCRSHDDADSLPKGVDICIGDVTKPGTLGSALRGVDTVIHLAGMVSYSESKEALFRVNAIGTKNLLAECRDVKRFILSSSVSVYGEIRGEAGEDYPLTPRTSYGESKAKAEQFVEGSGIENVILRIAPIYGEGSSSWRKNLGLLEKGFPVPSTNNLTHVVHVSDVVQAFVKSVEKGRGVYNIAGKSPMKFTEFAETLLKLLGRKPRRMPFFMVKAVASLMGMGAYLDVLTMNRNYSIRKAREELGYEPRALFSKEVKRMLVWYKETA